jgi:hypothetical protein
MSRSKAVRSGFSAVFREPAIFAAELAWRWAFGIAAWLLIVYALLMFLQSLEVTDRDYLGLLGIIPGTLGAALESIFRGSGPKLVKTGIVLWLGISVLWSLAASAGRAATLKALLPNGHAGFRNMFRLHALRAGLTFTAALAYVGSIATASVFARQGSTSRDETFFLVMIPLAVLVGVVWSVLTWYLTLAPVVSAHAGSGAFASMLDAAVLSRRQSSQFAWIGFFYGTLRYVAMALALFVLLMMLSLAAELPAGGGWAVLIAWGVGFSFVSAFIGVARLAAMTRIVQWDGSLIQPAGPKA